MLVQNNPNLLGGNDPNLAGGNIGISCHYSCCVHSVAATCLPAVCFEFVLLSNITLFSDLQNIKSYMMPTNKKLKNLLQASEAAASNTASQHILLSVSSEGKVHAAGSDNLVTGLVSDVELYKKIKACVKNNVMTDDSESAGYATTHALAYPALPCSPSSAEWKQLGTAAVRGILRDMLVCAGYGRGKGEKKLGVGPAPVGWPAQADWPNFKGSTRSGLKITAVTEIIISMLQAAGFSPETHVKPEDQASDVDGDSGPDETVQEYDVDVVQPSEGGRKGTCSGGLKRKFGSV